MAGEISKYKIGVEITGDDSGFKKIARSSEKAVSDLEKKTAGDFKKIGANFAGIFAGKAKDTGLGQFVSEVGEGTAALSAFAGPAAVVVGGVTAIGAAAVAAGGMLFSLAKSASDYGSEIADAQSKTGLAADSLSALRYQANLSGSDFGAVSGAVSKFSKLVGEAASGSAEAKAKLKALGIDPQDALRDLDGALGKAFKTINDAKPGVNQMTAAQNAFGKSGAELIPTIRGMNGDFAALKKRASELGITLSEEDVKAADEFGDTLDTLSIQAKAASSKFALQFAPEITGAMNDISEYLSKNKDKWKEWGEGVADNIRGVRNLINSEEVGTAQSWLKWLGNGINQYNPAMWGVKAIKNSGKESRAADYNTKLANFEYAIPGMLDTSAGFAPPKKVENDGNDYVNDLPSKSKKEKKEKEISLSVEDILAAMQTGTMGQESGGNQHARNRRTGASGLFQVMPENIPEWTQKTFGVSMSVEQFKKNAAAQIAVFNKYMGGYLKEGLAKSGGDWQEGVRRAAVKWYGTKSNTDDFAQMKRFRADEPSRGEYTQSVLNRTKKALGDKSGFKLPVLGGALEIGEGTKALADYAKQLALVGVTTQQGRVEVELMFGAYKDLDDAGKANLLLAAGEVDAKEAQSKAIEDLNGHLENLSGQYDDLNGVQKTATSELEKYLAAYAKTGNVIDPVIEANARNLALMIDMQKATAKLDEATAEMVARRREERDATWEMVSAQQAYNNELARDTGGKETNYGIAAGIAAPLADGSAAPKLKKKSSAYGIAAAASRGEFKSDGVFDQSTIDSQVSMMQTLKEAGTDAFASISQEIGGAISSWIAFGEASGQTLGELTANVLASVSAQALATGLMELGIGIAALTPWGAAVYGPAPLHFKSAAILMGIGAGFGIGARVAGAGGGKSSAGSDSPGQNPSEYFQSGNDARNMNYLRESPDSPAERQNSMLGEKIGQFVSAVETFDKKVNSTSAGDVFVAGANQNRGMFAERTSAELARNSTQAAKFGRVLGLA